MNAFLSLARTGINNFPAAHAIGKGHGKEAPDQLCKEAQGRARGEELSLKDEHGQPITTL